MVVSSTNTTFPAMKTLVRSIPSAGVEFDADEPVARRLGEVSDDGALVASDCRSQSRIITGGHGIQFYG